MGLLDVLNGMQNGPRGQRPPDSGSGGMSPVTLAVLGVLAYKAIKSFADGRPEAGPASPPGGANAPSTASGGGIGDLLKGGLGGLLGGAAAGNVLSSGLNDLLKQFQQSGQSDIAKSWVDTGPNKAISANDLAQVLGPDKINALMAHTGMSREELLDSLSRNLPSVVDQLTPQGRLPTEHEAARML
jgi:uncharacterized protein YidB (DUF937 family)